MNIIAWILCLIGTAMLVYWLPLIAILILLPVMGIYAGLRLPASKSIMIDSRIRFQMTDTGQVDFIRNSIELLSGNKRIFFADPIDGLEWVYVDRVDFGKLWPESPLEMNNKHYSIKARFKTYRLLFGGYAKAKVISIKKIEENPIIAK